MRLLFVCSGNICRSPMAEVLAQGRTLGDGTVIEARSAGTLGITDHPADPLAVRVCAELGLDLSRHRSQGLSARLVDEATWIPVMTLDHAATVRERFPSAGARIVLLGPFGGRHEIADPLGGGVERFRASRDELAACVDGMIVRLGGTRR